MVKISGYVAKPETARKKGALILKLDFGLRRMNIHINISRIDFKINEIRNLFADRKSLGKFSAIPSIDFDTEDMPDIPAFEQNLSSAPPTGINCSYASITAL